MFLESTTQVSAPNRHMANMSTTAPNYFKDYRNEAYQRYQLTMIYVK